MVYGLRFEVIRFTVYSLQFTIPVNVNVPVVYSLFLND